MTLSLTIHAEAPPRVSAHSLKELGHCGRKFALQYKQQTFWPVDAPMPETMAAHAALGQAFHTLVQVHALGLRVDAVLPALADPEGKLVDLWERFLDSPHAEPDPAVRSWTEQALNFTLAGVPFLARFDRLTEQDGEWTILDWKTGRVAADRLEAEDDWQTRLYRFALVEAGAALSGGVAIAPEQVNLVYWEVSTGIAHRLNYDARRHAADRAIFQERAEAVKAAFDPHDPVDGAFKRDKGHCKKCRFDSLCNRPTVPDATSLASLIAPRFAVVPQTELS